MRSIECGESGQFRRNQITSETCCDGPRCTNRCRAELAPGSCIAGRNNCKYHAVMTDRKVGEKFVCRTYVGLHHTLVDTLIIADRLAHDRAARQTPRTCRSRSEER